MTRITKVCVLAIGVVAAAAGAACGGDSEMSFLPTSPTGIGTSAGAVITGRVTGVTTPATSTDAFGALDSRSLTVSVVGTSISTTINGSGQFTLSGVPAGTVALKFTGSGVDATVTLSGISATDQIEITVSLNGGQARVDSERRGRGNGGEAEAKGLVSQLTGTCPALAFTVQGTRVTTTSTTAFDGIACATVANGMRLEVKGRRQDDGSIAASRVEAEDDDDDDNGRAEMKGPVASLGGTCPAVNFILQGARVTTSSATAFDDITCAGLRNGVQVEVHGQRQANGWVLATRIEAEDEDNGPRTDIEGMVSGLTGQCPAVAFVVQGTRVTTSSATSFRETSCARVANGMRVKVRGQRQADGSILALRVEEGD